MHRLILLVTAGALLALAEIPVSLWPQVAIGPPGTNNVQRTDVVPGVQSSIGGVVSGGVISGVPAVQPQATGPISPAGGAPSIVTGAPAGAPQQSSGGAGAVAVAPLQSAATQCAVRLATARTDLGPSGGLVEVAISPLPAHCKPSLGASSTWLQIAKDGAVGPVYRFSATPNTAPIARSANVVVGDQVFVVEQEGLIRTRLASAPARVVLGLAPKYGEQRREIALWADTPGAILAVVSNAPWLRVEARRSRKQDSRAFYVIVDNGKVPPGVRNEAAITVSADGAAPLLVPVIVERYNKR